MSLLAGLRSGVVHTMNPGERSCGIRYIATAVIGQPFNGMWKHLRVTLCQQNLHHYTADAPCGGTPADSLNTTRTTSRFQHDPLPVWLQCFFS